MNFVRYCYRINVRGSSSVFQTYQFPCYQIKSPSYSSFVPYKTSLRNYTSSSFASVSVCDLRGLLQPTIFHRNLCTDSGKGSENIPPSSQPGSGHKKLSRKEQFKIAFRDYGATVIVFHVCISLMSLGICYMLVSNGLDATLVLKAVGFSESVISSKVAVGGSTFVIAYAVHKLFTPLRMVITLSATPFIVRYLRRVGILKLPKSKK